MTRSESTQAMLHELGAVLVVAGALDPDQVAEAVGGAGPEVVVHQLTAIGSVDLRHMERDFAPANRLRAEGTDYLLSAGQAALARILGAEQPMRAPRLAAGEAGAVLMTELRGASNAKARREFGRRPARPSWRQGLAA